MEQFKYTGASYTYSNVPKLDVYLLSLINWPLSKRNYAMKKRLKCVDVIIFEFLLLKYSLMHCITKNVTLNGLT